jgi:putative protease
LGFESPNATGGPDVGFSVTAVRAVPGGNGKRVAVETRTRVDTGWRVIRTSDGQLLARARASYAALPTEIRVRKSRLDARLFGAAGTPLKAVFSVDGETVTVRSEVTLSQANKRPLDAASLREQLGRLGDTPFVLGALDTTALAPSLFLPVSEQNHLRQQAVDELMSRRNWAEGARLAERRVVIETAVATIDQGALAHSPTRPLAHSPSLSATVYRIDDADAAATAGATEICFDPFLRHPSPPLARIRALRERLDAQGVTLRLRTPTIVRPEERRDIAKWLDLGLPILTGHLGLLAELSREGRDVTADYAVNVFNAHTAAEIFRLGARSIVASVELTTDELADVVGPWNGAGFAAFVYGRPEGMTIEHCVLSAAFDRKPTTCRDLCVQKHANVELTDPIGYKFPVATDSACRNRLLHSRPVDAGEFLPRLWRAGVREYHAVFNVPGDDVSAIVGGYRRALDALAGGEKPDIEAIRRAVGSEFTRGHFARAV